MLSNTQNSEENVSLIVQLGTTNVGCTTESIAVSTIDNCQRNIVSISDTESQLLLPSDKKSSRNPLVKEEFFTSSSAVTSAIPQQIIEVDHFKPLNEISNVSPQTAANLKFKVSQDLKGSNSILNAAVVTSKHKSGLTEMNSSLVMPNFSSELSNLKRKTITDANNGSRVKQADQSLGKPRQMMHVPIPSQYPVNNKQKLAGEANLVATSDPYLGVKQRYNVEFNQQEGMNIKHVYYNRQSPHVSNSHSKAVSSHMPPPKWHNSNQLLSSNKQSSKGSSRSHFKSYGGVTKSYAANYPFTNYLQQQPKHRVITFNMVKSIPMARIKACQWRYSDDDLLDGTIEKRPRFHKHLPLNFQYVLQDHNYGAPPPLSPHPSSIKPSIGVNGIPVSNSQNRTTIATHTPVITASYKGIKRKKKCGLTDPYRKHMKKGKTTTKRGAGRSRKRKSRDQVSFLGPHIIKRFRKPNLGKAFKEKCLPNGALYDENEETLLSDISVPTADMTKNLLPVSLSVSALGSSISSSLPVYSISEPSSLESVSNSIRSPVEFIPNTAPSSMECATNAAPFSLGSGSVKTSACLPFESSTKSMKVQVPAMSEMLKDYSNSKVKSTDSNDPLGKFFSAIEESVRTLKPALQIQAKAKICALVTDLEMQSVE